MAAATRLRSKKRTTSKVTSDSFIVIAFELSTYDQLGTYLESLVRDFPQRLVR